MFSWLSWNFCSRFFFCIVLFVCLFALGLLSKEFQISPPPPDVSQWNLNSCGQNPCVICLIWPDTIAHAACTLCDLCTLDIMWEMDDKHQKTDCLAASQNSVLILLDKMSLMSSWHGHGLWLLPVPVPTWGWSSLCPAGSMYTVARGPTVIVQKTRRGETRGLVSMTAARCYCDQCGK